MDTIPWWGWLIMACLAYGLYTTRGLPSLAKGESVLDDAQDIALVAKQAPEAAPLSLTTINDDDLIAVPYDLQPSADARSIDEAEEDEWILVEDSDIG